MSVIYSARHDNIRFHDRLGLQCALGTNASSKLTKCPNGMGCWQLNFSTDRAKLGSPTSFFQRGHYECTYNIIQLYTIIVYSTLYCTS